jgi:hypothetical protein
MKTGALRSANRGTSYDGLSSAGSALAGQHRLIGRCKKCGKTSKLEGEILIARAPGIHDYVVRDQYGILWTTAEHGSSTTKVWAPCGDHHLALLRVTEGRKASKHECGARCTSATGPNCDCRCRGQNHGRDC